MDFSSFSSDDDDDEDDDGDNCFLTNLNSIYLAENVVINSSHYFDTAYQSQDFDFSYSTSSITFFLVN